MPRGALDDDWLPVIGPKQLVVITRDRRIRYRPVEKRLWITHRVRGFVLTGQRSQSTVDSLSILERHWTQVEALVDARPDGPWMYAATDQHLREITLA